MSDSFNIIIKSILESPKNINQIKKEIENSLGKININVSNKAKLIDPKSVELDIKRINNALDTLKINKDKVFSDSRITTEVKSLKKMEDMYRQGNISLKEYSTQMNTLRTRVAQVSGEFKNVNKDGYAFSEMIGLAAKKIAIWGISTNLIYGSVNQIRNGLDTLRELDTLMVDINKVTNLTVDAMERLKNSSFETASKYGQTAQSYLSGVAEFSRAGYESAAQGLSEISLLAQNVGELTAQQAEQFLLATDAAYKFKGSQEELTKVLDGVNQIDNEFATSIAKVSEGMTVAGSIASNAGVGVNELSAAIGTMTAITQRSGNEAGRAFRSILMNIRQVKGVTEDGEIIDDEALSKSAKALDNVDIKVHEIRNGIEELRNPMDVLKELSDRWSTLSSMDQSAITEALGGKYRGNQLVALVENFNMYEKMLAEYASSANSALTENEVRMTSWQTKINQLSNSVSLFWNNAISSDFVKDILTGLNGLIKVLDVLINNSFSSFIIQVGLTSAALYGLFIVSKALIGTQALGGIILFTGRLLNSFKLVATGASTLAFELTALSATTKALTATMLASPLFWIVAGTTAIYAIVKAVDKLTVSLEEQREIIQTLSSDIQNLQSEYDNLTSKTDRTEQEEKTLKVLQKQIEAKKELLALETKELVQKEYIQPNRTFYGQGTYVESKNENTQNIKNNIQTIKDSANALLELNDEYLKSDQSLDDYTNKKDKLNKKIAESTNLLSDEYKTIKLNMKSLEEAGMQDSKEYILLNNLSNSIEEVINQTVKNTEETDKSTVANKNNVDSITLQKDAVSTLATTYKESSASIKNLNNILSELDEGKGLSADSITKILESYPELIDYLDDEVKLREKITDKVDDYQDAIYDAFVATKQNSNEFYNSVKNENVDLFNNLAKAYNSDIDNWSNLAQAKQEINAKLISQLGADWVKYFEAFNAGTALISPTSGADFSRISSSGALAIDSTTAKQFELLNALNEATRKQAEKFKNLNVSSSLGSSSSSSSSSKYISDQYALSISALNTEISQLEGLLSKLNPTSEEYRQKLQQINSLTKQKQILTEQEAIRLRALRAETAKGTEEYDDYTKSIESLSSAWWDFEKTISDTQSKIKEALVEQYKNALQKDLDNQEKKLEHIVELAEKRIANYETEIQSLEKQADLEQEITERQERQLEIQKLQLELENTRKEKTDRVLTKQADGTYSWVWQSNASTIANLEEQIAEKEADLAKWEADLVIEAEKERLQALVNGEEAYIKTRQESFNEEKELYDTFFTDLENTTVDALDSLNDIYSNKLNVILNTIKNAVSGSSKSNTSNSSSNGNVYTTDSKGNKIYVDSSGTIHKYKSGGETESTGLHWLDGKKGKPERVLSAEQTVSFDKLVNFLPQSLSMINNIMNNLKFPTPNFNFAGASGGGGSVNYYISGVTVKANDGDQFISSLTNMVKTK